MSAHESFSPSFQIRLCVVCGAAIVLVGILSIACVIARMTLLWRNQRYMAFAEFNRQVRVTGGLEGGGEKEGESVGEGGRRESGGECRDLEEGGGRLGEIGKGMPEEKRVRGPRDMAWGGREGGREERRGRGRARGIRAKGAAMKAKDSLVLLEGGSEQGREGRREGTRIRRGEGEEEEVMVVHLDSLSRGRGTGREGGEEGGEEGLRSMNLEMGLPTIGQ